MNRIWSENRYMDICINVLLFMVGINFMHYGQLILPIICFLLFIDNKLRFKVNDPKIFIVLCLFGISFYAFSYKLGFYSVMGFTCPMAYYIGSNIRYPSENNLRKLLYLLALSMNLHVILNIAAEISLHGLDRLIHSSTHYDFWTRQKMSNTGTAINCDLLVGILYYVILKEKNKALRIVCFVSIALSALYLLIIGKRTFLLLLFVTFAVLFLYEVRTGNKASEKTKKFMVRSLIAVFAFLAVFMTVYSLDLFSCRSYLDELKIVYKLKDGFISDERFRVYIGAWKLVPHHLFGGQQISSTLGMPVHELWMDIFDYAGIVPYLLMIVYSLSYLRNIIRLYRSDKIKTNTKIMVFGAYVCIIVQMFLEPIMTGASLFLLIAIMIDGLVDSMTCFDGSRSADEQSAVD